MSKCHPEQLYCNCALISDYCGFINLAFVEDKWLVAICDCSTFVHIDQAEDHGQLLQRRDVPECVRKGGSGLGQKSKQTSGKRASRALCLHVKRTLLFHIGGRQIFVLDDDRFHGRGRGCSLKRIGWAVTWRYLVSSCPETGNGIQKLHWQIKHLLFSFHGLGAFI